MSKGKIIIRISEFTTVPGARYISDGDGSAEEFFEKHLKPALIEAKETSILLDFDGTWGYASSFKSELALRIAAFYKDKKFDDIMSIIKIKTEEEPGLAHRFWEEVRDEHKKLQPN